MATIDMKRYPNEAPGTETVDLLDPPMSRARSEPWMTQDQIDLQTSRESLLDKIIAYLLLLIYFFVDLAISVPMLLTVYAVLMLLRWIIIRVTGCIISCCGSGFKTSERNYRNARILGWVFAILDALQALVVTIVVNLCLENIDSDIATKIQEEGLQSYQIALYVFGGFFSCVKMVALFYGGYVEEKLVTLAGNPADKVEIRNPKVTTFLAILNGWENRSLLEYGRNRLLEMLLYLISAMVAAGVGFMANWMLDARFGMVCDSALEVHKSVDCFVVTPIDGVDVCCYVIPHMFSPMYFWSFLGGTVIAFYGLYSWFATALLAHFGFLMYEGEHMELDDKSKLPSEFATWFYNQNLAMTKAINEEADDWQTILGATTEKSLLAVHMRCLQDCYAFTSTIYPPERAVESQKLKKIKSGALVRIDKRIERCYRKTKYNRKFVQFGRVDASDSWVILSEWTSVKNGGLFGKTKYFETVQDGFFAWIWYYMLCGQFCYNEEYCCCRKPFNIKEEHDPGMLSKMWYAVCCGWACVGCNCCKDDPYKPVFVEFRSDRYTEDIQEDFELTTSASV